MKILRHLYFFEFILLPKTKIAPFFGKTNPDLNV